MYIIAIYIDNEYWSSLVVNVCFKWTSVLRDDIDNLNTHIYKAI